MPGPSKRLEAGQQDELVGTAAARDAGGVSAVWRRRGEFASITVSENFREAPPEQPILWKAELYKYQSKNVSAPLLKSSREV